MCWSHPCGRRGASSPLCLMGLVSTLHAHRSGSDRRKETVVTDSERQEYRRWRDDTRAYEEMLESEKAALQAWIRLAVRPSEAKRTESSYIVKHDFGRDGFFVTAAQFDGALLSAGYEGTKSDRFPIDPRVAAPFRSDTYAGFCLEHLDAASRAEYALQLRKAV